MQALHFATLPIGSTLSMPITPENAAAVMAFLATQRVQFNDDPSAISWKAPGSDESRYLVPTNMSALDISPADVEPDVTSATNIVCGQCGALNYTKDPKQYYAVTAGSQVGVVKGADIGRGLIDYISGGVVIGFRTESLAVEHFQKGVRAGSVRVIPARPM
ncbi:hypothetical protein CCMSSC00406_0007138 [Pleurotus cornucopiae]|uniref:Uncharacterized protein n=1 Tax=Pleurotus cornucopiae TaxID=5321 RepID=A0ACB7IPJ2_PLECO|nr:hypothetical protein CCMSSC00406_0007138 [Pleurotus cornucopiae]